MASQTKSVAFRGEITGLVGRGTTLLFTTRHAEGQATALYQLTVDKAELKALAEGNSFFDNQRFAITFEPRDPKTAPLAYIPPVGKVVAVKGKWQPNEEGTLNVLPVQTRGQEEPKLVPLQHLIIVEKSDLMSSGKSNVLTLYTKRVEHIRSVYKRILAYEADLQKVLAREADREKVFEF